MQLMIVRNIQQIKRINILVSLNLCKTINKAVIQQTTIVWF